MNGSANPPRTLVGGIARLAFFNRSGFVAVGHTRQAFLASLAPVVAFVLVGAAVQSLSGNWRLGLGSLLQSLVVVAGQPVLSHLIATRWGRQSQWLRYATAINWCQFAIPIVAMLFVTLALLAGSTLGPDDRGVYAVMGCILTYAVLLNGFIAWRGLDLPLWRAVLLVVLVTIGLGILVMVPEFARLALMGGGLKGLQT